MQVCQVHQSNRFTNPRLKAGVLRSLSLQLANQLEQKTQGWMIFQDNESEFWQKVPLCLQWFLKKKEVYLSGRLPSYFTLICWIFCSLEEYHQEPFKFIIYSTCEAKSTKDFFVMLNDNITCTFFYTFKRASLTITESQVHTAHVTLLILWNCDHLQLKFEKI